MNPLEKPKVKFGDKNRQLLRSKALINMRALTYSMFKYGFYIVALFASSLFYAISVQASNDIEFWSGELLTPSSRGEKYPVDLWYQQNAEGKLEGFIYYPDLDCIFPLLGDMFYEDRHKRLTTGFSELAPLAKCEHKVVSGFLTLLKSEDGLRVFGKHLRIALDPNGSLIKPGTEDRKNFVLAKLAEITEQEKNEPVFWRGDLRGNYGEIIRTKILIPRGVSLPNEVFIKIDGESSACQSSTYSQELNGSALVVSSHTDGCEVFKHGYFDINTDVKPIQVHWKANSNSIVQTQPIFSSAANPAPTGEMWQLLNYYQKHSDMASFAQMAPNFVKQYEEKVTSFNSVTLETLQASEFGPKYIGAWEGMIEFNNDLQQASLALWHGKLLDYSQIMGYLTINETCFYGVILTNNVGKATLSYHKENTTGVCDGQLRTKLIGLNAYLDASLNTLLVLNVRKQKPDRIRKAVFKRSQPTPYLNSLIETVDKRIFVAPSKEELALISSATAPGSGLQGDIQTSFEDSDTLRKDREELGKRRAAEEHRREREKYFAEKAQREELSGGAQSTRYNGKTPRLPKVKGPFDGLPGSTFLNAVYSGNKSQVQQINDYYNYQQQEGLRKFAGSYRNQLTDKIIELQNAVRIQDSVTARYLFNYESEFGRCLSSSPSVFYVVGYQPDYVITNLLGEEIARIHGGTRKTKYTVNSEFENTFQRIGKLKLNDSLARQLTSAMAANGNEDLRASSMNGIDSIFNKFDCNDPVIKRFERNLIKLY